MTRCAHSCTMMATHFRRLVFARLLSTPREVRMCIQMRRVSRSVIVHMSANVVTWPHDPLGGNRQNFLDSRDVRSFSSLPISGDWLKRCPHLPRPLRRGRTPLSARWSPRPHLQACIDAPLTLRPGAVSLVPTGIAIHTADPGPAAIVLPRSGLAHKHGTVLANLWRISPRTGSGAGGCGSSGTR